MSKLLIWFISDNFLGAVGYDNIFVTRYYSITNLLAAIFLFLFCLNIKISDPVSKVVLFFSPATLGVYLIHVHPFIFDAVIKDAFVSFVKLPVVLMPLCVIGVSILIFLVCSVIDLLRIQLFKLIRVAKFSEFLSKKINAIYLRIFEK